MNDQWMHNMDGTVIDGRVDTSDGQHLPSDNQTMQSLDTFEDNVCPKSHKKAMSMSSKNSIHSNTSEDKHSTNSLRPEKSGQKWPQMRVAPIKDIYCWDCHRNGVDFSCKACQRSYHEKCPSHKKLTKSAGDHHLCPECTDIMKSEEGTNPSGCMQWLNGNVNELSELLKYTIDTVKAADKNRSFYEPVSTQDYPDYTTMIVNPMDLSQVEHNIRNKTYASTNSFLADIKWIYHNCIVFNQGVNQPLITEVKNVIRVAKQECEEIEICPDCYHNYYTMEEETYFAAVCRRPHAIVWAKLKGHPYWPAKVVRCNESRHEVDVRFFGTHDKCWLKPDKCFQMSRNYPNNKKPSKFDQNKFEEAIRDMNSHLDQLDKHHPGQFRFYDKHTTFTVDQLYLSSNSTPTQLSDQLNGDDNSVSPKKVLNTYNGISFKKLKVKTLKFDVRNHLNDCLEATDESKSSPNKRLKTLNISTKRCISQSVGVRQELNSSIDSDNSLMDSKNGSQMDLSSIADSNANICHQFDENNVEMNGCEDNQSNHSSTSVMSRTQTFTVSGKSTKIINIDKPVAIDSNSFKTSHSSPNKKLNFIPKPKNESEEESVKKRLKASEFQVRKLNEELDEKNIEVNSLRERCEDLKRTNEELVKTIPELKRKQWCTNCLNEAILPCCWNTCYCTIECQHKHWPIHAKSCRRRQVSK